MSALKNLKLSSTKRVKLPDNPVQRLRAKLAERLGEQLQLAKADIAGEPFVKMHQVYVRDTETGQRVARQEQKRLRRWYWHDINGIWYLELRYGNKVIEINKGKTAIEVGERDRLVEVLGAVIAAVDDGELDAILLAAKQKRNSVKSRI